MKLYSINRIVRNIYLCIRFPFLYPRNRFTGLHYNNCKINDFILDWEPLSEDTFYFHVTNEEDLNFLASNFITSKYFPSKKYRVSERDNYIYIVNDTGKLVASVPPDQFKGYTIKSVYVKDNDIKVLVNEPVTQKPFVYVTIVHNKLLNNICKIMNWINRYPLQMLYCIPTYTELDAMPNGWRKAFGIKMCKEIKKALKKTHSLKDYRILQIKEKWGYLHWYDSGENEELRQIINKYADLSINTCINCGKPYEVMSEGWISPYCKNCYDSLSRNFR